MLNIGILEEIENVLGVANGTKSHPVGIVKNVEVYMGKLKLLDGFYIIDMKKDPTCPLLIGRGFLATASVVIDCNKDKIKIGKGVTRTIFGVKEIGLGYVDTPYWTTLSKWKSYESRPSTNYIGFMDWSYYQGRVVEMDGCSKDRFMYTHLLNMLAAKVKGNIWALFCCIPEIELQNGGLKIIENDVDVHAMYDLAEIHKKINKWGKNVAATVIQDDVEGIDVIDAEVFEVLDSIDAKVLAKQQKLDKGKGKMSEVDIFTMRITIKVKVKSDCSEKSFDYLSDCDDEEECTQSSKFEDVLNNDVVLTPLVKEHEMNMQSLLKKLKENHMGITDPFAIVEKQNENTSKKVIAKCGKRKEVIKDADIGKQRAFKIKFTSCNKESYALSLRSCQNIRVILKSYALSWKPCQGDSLNLPDHRAQVDQESQIKMIQVKEMMQDNDLKNSKSKDKGSRSRSQSMNEQSHYKQDKTKTRQSINVKSHILNVIGGTEECEERDLNIGGDC
ncbi:pentatricopeptide repeat-containing protein [Tanacetum coccineum]|uniref:Pentatricopeptide repeat-containing protein n=1 Tax=Tanacetum coccineum TaxID=301880 RepID=A0ABQ4ZWJ6_9ASTR